MEVKGRDTISGLKTVRDLDRDPRGVVRAGAPDLRGDALGAGRGAAGTVGGHRRHGRHARRWWGALAWHRRSHGGPPRPPGANWARPADGGRAWNRRVPREARRLLARAVDRRRRLAPAARSKSAAAAETWTRARRRIRPQWGARGARTAFLVALAAGARGFRCAPTRASRHGSMSHLCQRVRWPRFWLRGAGCGNVPCALRRRRRRGETRRGDRRTTCAARGRTCRRATERSATFFGWRRARGSGRTPAGALRPARGAARLRPVRRHRAGHAGVQRRCVRRARGRDRCAAERPRVGRRLRHRATFCGRARIETDGVREEVRCVVGGLASMSRADSGRLFLSVTAPSARLLPQALARVDERLSPLARFARGRSDGLSARYP